MPTTHYLFFCNRPLLSEPELYSLLSKVQPLKGLGGFLKKIRNAATENMTVAHTGGREKGIATGY